jgi:ABC-2 type transport system permease protein
MQAFKVYFKVVRASRMQMLVYVIVFLGVTMVMSSLYGGSVAPQAASFSAVRSKAAVISYDEDSPLLKGFVDYLSASAQLEDISGEGEALQDALFFHAIEFAVKIPKGFTQAFLDGEDVSLEMASSAYSADTVFLKDLVDRYFNTAALYVKHGAGLDQTEIVQLVASDLRASAPVRVEAAASAQPTAGEYVYVLNYMSYPLFAMLILGVVTIMLVFNQTDLKRRNLCAPVPSAKTNLQVFLGHLIYGVICWALMCLIGVGRYVHEMVSVKGLWACLNAFAFMLACLGISFLVGTLIKKSTVVPAIQNILALGTSFLSGAFVPQYLLGKTVLTIASFTPTYWYVRANHAIAELPGFSLTEVAPILGYMLILLGFGAAALLVALAAARKQSGGSAN